MKTLEQKFQKIVEEHTQTLAERRTLKSILNDYFPKDDERKFVNALLAAYDLNIHQAIVQCPDKPDRFFISRYIQRIEHEYGIKKVIAEVAVQAWVNCLHGKKLPVRAQPLLAPTPTSGDSPTMDQNTHPGSKNKEQCTESEMRIIEE